MTRIVLLFQVYIVGVRAADPKSVAGTWLFAVAFEEGLNVETGGWENGA
jgi:hypothetical protein